MSRLPADSRAMRRELYGLAAGFVIGFVVTLIGNIWFTVRVLFPEHGWWAIPEGILQALLFPLLVGSVMGFGIQWTLARWHYARGAYPCVHCGRARRWGNRPCECLLERGDEVGEAMRRWAKRRRPTGWRHYARRVPAVLMTYLAVAPVAIGLASVAPGARVGSWWVNVVVFHGLICAMMAILAEGVDTLAPKKWGQRWRLRLRVYAMVLVVWPMLMAVMGMLGVWG